MILRCSLPMPPHPTRPTCTGSDMPPPSSLCSACPVANRLLYGNVPIEIVPVSGDGGRPGEVRLYLMDDPGLLRSDPVSVKQGFQIGKQKAALTGQSADSDVERAKRLARFRREAEQGSKRIRAVRRVVDRVDDDRTAKRCQTFGD